MELGRRQRKTLARVFQTPPRSDVRWPEVEALLGALDAELTEGRGSRLRVALGGARAVLHRPHPSSIVSKPCLRAVKRFLMTAGIQPEE
jgi:hypothetical protein